MYLNLNGVDVYYPDKKNRSASNFGKLMIISFPFMAGLSYDDCNEIVYFKTQTELRELVEINKSPDVMEKKSVRLKLRALNQK